MPTTTTKNHVGTWLDWEAKGALESTTDSLLTRTELLDELRRQGVDIPERTLMYWEEIGALPRPVRRHHRGLTRVVYPPWTLALIADVPRLQQAGYSLQDIGRRFQQVVANDHITITAVEHASVQAFPEPTDVDFASLLESARQRFTMLSGLNVTGIELVISDETGQCRTYRLTEHASGD